MSGQSTTFLSPSVFLVSALCVFATPLALVTTVCPRPRGERTIYPSVAEVLRQNEALVVAAKAAREADLDLSDTQYLLRDDNAVWIERTLASPKLLTPEAKDALGTSPYWAILFRPQSHPDWYVEWERVLWVMVRQSDMKVVCVLRDEN